MAPELEALHDLKLLQQQGIGALCESGSEQTVSQAVGTSTLLLYGLVFDAFSRYSSAGP